MSGIASLEAPLAFPFRLALRACLLGGSPAALYSPLAHAASAVPSTAYFLVTCEYELPSLRALSRCFGARLASAGCAVTFREIQRECHFTAVRRIGAILQTVLDDLDQSGELGPESSLCGDS